MKASSAAAAIPGRTSGRATMRNARLRVYPSSSAACSSSGRRSWKYDRRIHTTSGIVTSCSTQIMPEGRVEQAQLVVDHEQRDDHHQLRGEPEREHLEHQVLGTPELPPPGGVGRRDPDTSETSTAPAAVSMLLRQRTVEVDAGQRGAAWLTTVPKFCQRGGEREVGRRSAPRSVFSASSTIQRIGNSEKTNQTTISTSAMTPPGASPASGRGGPPVPRQARPQLSSARGAPLRPAQHAHQVPRGGEHDHPQQEHVRAAARVVEMDDRVLVRADLQAAVASPGPPAVST